MTLYFFQLISLAALVLKRKCKGTKVCIVILAKKSEVRFRKNAGALLKKQSVFQRVVLSAKSVITAPNDVLSETLTVIF